MQRADLVFRGGRVLTMDDNFTIAAAVAVTAGTITAVGSDADIEEHIGPATELVELAGRTLLPGINDSHLHAAAWGMSRPPYSLDVAFPAVQSIADLVAAVSEAAANKAPGEWIVGQGWDAGYLQECVEGSRSLPGRRDLDSVSPDNPVCLTDFSGHMVLANSAALRIGNVTSDSDPGAGGVIDVDAVGEPTGILREGAQQLVQRHVPRLTDEQLRDVIRTSIARLHSLGITSFTEPGLGPGGEDLLGGGLGTRVLDAYLELAQAGELQSRVSVLLLPATMGGTAEEVRDGLVHLASRDPVDTRRLAIIGVKLFADGVPPNKTAWMNEDYPGGGNGALCVHGATAGLQEHELHEMVRAAHEAGFQVGVHVTGDRAIDSVVDAFAAANAASPRADARHYVIHGDFTSARSLGSLAQHGYGVNMNPGIKWAIADLMEEVVGEQLAAYQWPVKSALEAGVAVCASSDAPITEPLWLQGVAAMMLRQSRATGKTSGPEERVNLEEALRTYSCNPARQDFAENWKGSIEPGKVADLCVLGADVTRTEPEDLPGMQVELTVFDGQIVYRAP